MYRNIVDSRKEVLIRDWALWRSYAEQPLIEVYKKVYERKMQPLRIPRTMLNRELRHKWNAKRRAKKAEHMRKLKETYTFISNLGKPPKAELPFKEQFQEIIEQEKNLPDVKHLRTIISGLEETLGLTRSLEDNMEDNYLQTLQNSASLFLPGSLDPQQDEYLQKMARGEVDMEVEDELDDPDLFESLSQAWENEDNVPPTPQESPETVLEKMKATFKDDDDETDALFKDLIERDDV
jgi:hypothetical protein